MSALVSFPQCTRRLGLSSGYAMTLHEAGHSSSSTNGGRRPADGENSAFSRNFESDSLLARLRSRFIAAFEGFFYQHGRNVSNRPLLYIFIVVLVTAVCSVGLLRLQFENRPFKLWLPQQSDFVRTFDWMQRNFPRQFLFEYAILTADNVLHPNVLREMASVRQQVVSHQAAPAGASWPDVCLRLPSIVGGVTQNGSDTYSFVEYDENEVDRADKRRRRRRWPHTAMISERQRRQIPRLEFDVSALDASDPSVFLPTSFYCSVLAELPSPCWESSLLELWAFNESQLASVSGARDVVQRVNTVSQSPVFGYNVDLSQYLGGVRRNASGHIVSARAALFTWAVRRASDDAAASSHTSDIGTGEVLDARTVLFEDHFLQVMSTAATDAVNTSRNETGSNMRWFFSAAKSFGDVSSAAVFGDVRLLVLGYVVMFVFVVLSLGGRCDLVHHRAILSVLGVSSVFMAVLISYGVCSLAGLHYGPVHNILPLLLLGLGVDDMFIIVQCLHVQQRVMSEPAGGDQWTVRRRSSNLNQHKCDEPQHSGDAGNAVCLERLMGETMRRAGCSITVTSATDVLAFAVGASTQLPALRSFCVFAAVGVLAVYFIQATWLVALLSLDQRRIAAGRDGLLPCVRHHRTQSREHATPSHWLQQVFERVYTPALLSRVGKCLTIVVSVVVLALNSWGLWHLRQQFNPLWFLPSHTYLAQYHRHLDRYFSSRNGADAVVLIAGVDIEASLPHMALLSAKLAADASVQRVDSWYDQFAFYVNYHGYGHLPHNLSESGSFHQLLGQFLFSARGGRFQHHFRFAGELRCGTAAPAVLATTVAFTHRGMSEQRASLRVAAMQRIKRLVASVAASMTRADNASDIVVAPLSQSYAAWETDAVIGGELWRNLALACLCVLVVTGLLVADTRACLLVLACVLLTVLDVAGLMAHWGLTVDTVSCIDLVISVGLCVDYAAHVAHAFVTCATTCGSRCDVSATRQRRAIHVLNTIGPAVFCGAASTFLAFVFLAGSDSHVFITFYKVLLSVTVLGAWHGLALLPVVLSLCGPVSTTPSTKPPSSESDDAPRTPQQAQPLQVRL